MEPITLLLNVVLFISKVGAGIALVVVLSWIGTMVYDEIKHNSNDLYEIALSAAVGIEFLFRGRPKSAKPDYRGRHRLDDPFISDLVVEMRQLPRSLCYDDTPKRRLALTA
jgi:hypothetical protein